MLVSQTGTTDGSTGAPRGTQGGLSQLPLFPFQDLFWSEGEGENKTKNKRTTNRMQLRHTIVVLDPKRWDLYFL